MHLRTNTHGAIQSPSIITSYLRSIARTPSFQGYRLYLRWDGMEHFKWNMQLCAAALALGMSGSPAHAAADVTVAELQAVAQTLGFLSNHPNAVLNIGIVYAQDQPSGEARAVQASILLDAIPGPDQRTLHGTPVAVKDLGRAAQPFDAYLLMPGTPSQGAAINDAVRRHHIISISTDPACLDANCCVLMVSTQGRVRIVLDTALADAAGARFSSVFAMMVSHK